MQTYKTVCPIVRWDSWGSESYVACLKVECLGFGPTCLWSLRCHLLGWMSPGQMTWKHQRHFSVWKAVQGGSRILLILSTLSSGTWWKSWPLLISVRKEETLLLFLSSFLWWCWEMFSVQECSASMPSGHQETDLRLQTTLFTTPSHVRQRWMPEIKEKWHGQVGDLEETFRNVNLINFSNSVGFF